MWSAPSARSALAALLLGSVALAVPASGCGDASDGGDASPGLDDATGGDPDGAGDEVGDGSTDEPGAPPECVLPSDCSLPESLDAACHTIACVDGACLYIEQPDLSTCDDADPCTTETRCASGVCGGGVAALCADGDPCTLDACDVLTGCVHDLVSDGRPCDDDDPCTEGEKCTADGCVGEPLAACACTDDKDCVAFDDDNLCNGVMRCVDGQCALDPASVVVCPVAGKCRVAACSPDSGACTTLLAPTGTPCSDGNPCTAEDVCEAGTCAGTPGVCSCAEDADCKPFQRSGYDLCGGPLTCQDGVCAPDAEQAVTCEGAPGDPCLTLSCDPSTALCATVPAPQGQPCPSVDPCAPDGICDLGVCLAAEPDCGDGDPCTEDHCDAEIGCYHVVQVGPCNDGDPCTTGESCAEGTCGGGQGVVCDDLNPCTIDKCQSGAGGCTTSPAEDGIACQGGDPCEVGGHCQGGQCVGHSDLECPDPGPCSTASCVPGEGCVTKLVADGTPCEADLPCSQPGACQDGVCEALPLACGDGNPCTVDTCDPATGDCVHTEAEPGTACDPSDPCLVDGVCDGGQCLDGVPVSCPSSACSVEACDTAAGGCVVVATLPDGTPCGALGPCVQAGECADGACSGAGPVTCDDDDPCTLDTCDAELDACVHESVACAQPNDPCQIAVCDDGCGLADAPACLTGSVLWASSQPCDLDVWTVDPPEAFAVAEPASPPGSYDGDCALVGAGGTLEAPASATAEVPLVVDAAGTKVRVSFVEAVPGEDDARHVAIVDADGATVGVEPLDPSVSTSWTGQGPLPFVIDAPGTYRLRLVLQGAGPWLIDKLVVTATAP